MAPKQYSRTSLLIGTLVLGVCLAPPAEVRLSEEEEPPREAFDARISDPPEVRICIDERDVAIASFDPAQELEDATRTTTASADAGLERARAAALARRSKATGPVKVKTVPVGDDQGVIVVVGETSTPIVYLHGRCGDPKAFLQWAEEARAFGTIISLVGDTKCRSGGRAKWTEDAAAIDTRVTNALASVRSQLGVPLDDRRIVIGYSQGALRAESLAAAFPARYPRPVLIAGPRGPHDDDLQSSEAVLLMVGDHDVRDPLRQAAEKLEEQGTPVRYLELPWAHHGQYGPKGGSMIQRGLEWLSETPSPLVPHPTP